MSTETIVEAPSRFSVILRREHDAQGYPTGWYGIHLIDREGVLPSVKVSAAAGEETAVETAKVMQARGDEYLLPLYGYQIAGAAGPTLH